jgi:hypothetical protein
VPLAGVSEEMSKLMGPELFGFRVGGLKTGTVLTRCTTHCIPSLAGNSHEPEAQRMPRIRESITDCRTASAKAEDEFEGIAPPPTRKRQLIEASVLIHPPWAPAPPSPRTLLRMCGRGASTRLEAPSDSG